MSRAARRRAEREAAKGFGAGQTLTLENPVSHHFQSWIFGNATKCDAVLEPDEAEGQSLLICGAGPSLADHIADHDADQVWGCNSAAVWLADNGHRVTHGFTVDQTPAMLEEWATAPDIEYLLATTVHPHLTDYLRAKNRLVRFFHNYVGIKEAPVELCQCGHGAEDHVQGPCTAEGCVCEGYESHVVSYEDWLYGTLYPPTLFAGSGLNSVNRALDIALQMGFARITILGADCALRVTAPPPDAPAGSPPYMAWLRESTVMHADGGHALASGATPVTMNGMIDGRLWVTKPDMVISAVWLEKARQSYVGRVEIVGDTLVNALRDKPDSYLRRLPSIG